MARRNFEISKTDYKRQYDRYVHVPKFEIGVTDESVRRGRSKSLEAPYFVPYKIVGIEAPNVLVRIKTVQGT
jgi:hypothetical protein